MANKKTAGQSNKGGDQEVKGVQGGTHEQHVEAGRQSHKNHPAADKHHEAASRNPRNSGAAWLERNCLSVADLHSH